VTRRIVQAYGAYEPLAAPNREMTDTLRRLGDEVRVIEALDGHNWTNWRDRLLDGLGWLLPPEATVEMPAGEAYARWA
jgi:enterochelin esterase family protein